jgi:dsDNA-specific endonuclease/ATPase MutS2
MTSSTKSELKELKELILAQNGKLEAKLNELQKDIGNLRGEVKEDINNLRSEVKEDINNLRSEVKEDINNLKHELKEDISKLKADISKLEGTMIGWSNSIQKIPDLAEKVGELKNWRRIAFLIITGGFGTILGWFIRSGRI